jgi:hypothetical protein
MSDEQTRVGEFLSRYEESERFLVAGAVAAVLSWVFIPLLFGLAAIYCGYRLYNCSDRRITSAVIVFMGASAVINWLVYIVNTI